MYAYCSNNPVMNVDPTGEFAISAIIIEAIIGAIIGFGGTVLTDYLDDGQVFNGSVAWYDYLGATVLGGVIGAGISYALPYISSFASTTFALGGGGLAVSGGGAAAVAAGFTITGAQVLGAAGVAGLILLAELPMHGSPNTTINNESSFGEYDENGNLFYRVDLKGRPHFIKSKGQYYLPHIHRYKWSLIDGIWRFIEEVFPYFL